MLSEQKMGFDYAAFATTKKVLKANDSSSFSKGEKLSDGKTKKRPFEWFSLSHEWSSSRSHNDTIENWLFYT